MMKLVKKVAIGTVAFFAILAVLGAIISVVDPEGTKRRQEQSEKHAEQKRQNAEAQKTAQADSKDRIFTHGFTAGYSMAKGGAVKPSDDEVDALARRAANALGEGGGLAFKVTWKQAFWSGWRKGD